MDYRTILKGAEAAAELDADRPIGVVELRLFGGGEIPIADHIEIRRDLVGDGTPLPFEIKPGRPAGSSNCHSTAARARAAATIAATRDIPG
jgi:hypothetical protein